MPLNDLGMLQEVLSHGVFKQAPPKAPSTTGSDLSYDMVAARHCVTLLAASRADGYADWFKVGSALARLGPDMEGAFIEFSKR